MNFEKCKVTKTGHSKRRPWCDYYQVENEQLVNKDLGVIGVPNMLLDLCLWKIVETNSSGTF